jgi:DNA-directed RNA polymerase specialized sigma24 family protein
MAMRPGDAARARAGWRLSVEAFDRLLACLDPDRERAAERYEAIRLRLSKLFAWRGCADPSSLVDVTFDRVARRLDEGVDLHVSDPYAYFHGVAIRVLQEHWRSPARGAQPLEVLGKEGPPAPDVPAVDEVRAEGRLGCLRKCLDVLAPESRQLLERYHRGGPGPRIRARKDLARELRVSPVALRLRAYRIRAELQRCIEACERGAGNGFAARS